MIRSIVVLLLILNQCRGDRYPESSIESNGNLLDSPDERVPANNTLFSGDPQAWVFVGSLGTVIGACVIMPHVCKSLVARTGFETPAGKQTINVKYHVVNVSPPDGQNNPLVERLVQIPANLKEVASVARRTLQDLKSPGIKQTDIMIISGLYRLIWETVQAQEPVLSMLKRELARNRTLELETGSQVSSAIVKKSWTDLETRLQVVQNGLDVMKGWLTQLLGLLPADKQNLLRQKYPLSLSEGRVPASSAKGRLGAFADFANLQAEQLMRLRMQEVKKRIRDLEEKQLSLWEKLSLKILKLEKAGMAWEANKRSKLMQGIQDLTAE